MSDWGLSETGDSEVAAADVSKNDRDVGPFTYGHC